MEKILDAKPSNPPPSNPLKKSIRRHQSVPETVSTSYDIATKLIVLSDKINLRKIVFHVHNNNNSVADLWQN